MSSFFQNISRKNLSLAGLGDEIQNFVISGPDNDYQLIIGSDSRSKKNDKSQDLDLVTAVVIHRKGCGGRYFWSKRRIKHIYSLKEKLYQETIASLEAARLLMEVLKEKMNGYFEELEIHIDVGEKGPSREMIKELVGMVNGNGFKAKTKPSAFAASSVADKYT